MPAHRRAAGRARPGRRRPAAGRRSSGRRTRTARARRARRIRRCRRPPVPDVRARAASRRAASSAADETPGRRMRTATSGRLENSTRHTVASKPVIGSAAIAGGRSSAISAADRAGSIMSAAYVGWTSAIDRVLATDGRALRRVLRPQRCRRLPAAAARRRPSTKHCAPGSRPRTSGGRCAPSSTCPATCADDPRRSPRHAGAHPAPSNRCSLSSVHSGAVRPQPGDSRRSCRWPVLA